MSTQPQDRYNNVAIFLHWIMAISFILMLGSGLAMEYLELGKSLKFNMFQWHKSLGVILLVAFFIRISWRLLHKPPALPVSFSHLEKIGAEVGHCALYVLMFAVPLAGWAMVSSSVYGLPTIVFGLFEWPHIPGVAGNEMVSDISRGAHKYLAWAFGLTILGHIGAVIMHKIVQNENILSRMLPHRAVNKQSTPLNGE